MKPGRIRTARRCSCQEPFRIGAVRPCRALAVKPGCERLGDVEPTSGGSQERPRNDRATPVRPRGLDLAVGHALLRSPLAFFSLPTLAHRASLRGQLGVVADLPSAGHYDCERGRHANPAVTSGSKASAVDRVYQLLLRNSFVHATANGQAGDMLVQLGKFCVPPASDHEVLDPTRLNIHLHRRPRAGWGGLGGIVHLIPITQ